MGFMVVHKNKNGKWGGEKEACRAIRGLGAGVGDGEGIRGAGGAVQGVPRGGGQVQGRHGARLQCDRVRPPDLPHPGPAPTGLHCRDPVPQRDPRYRHPRHVGRCLGRPELDAWLPRGFRVIPGGKRMLETCASPRDLLFWGARRAERRALIGALTQCLIRLSSDVAQMRQRQARPISAGDCVELAELCQRARGQRAQGKCIC